MERTMAVILYLEDESWQAKLCVSVLITEFRHKIILCHNVKAAERFLLAGPYDVLVADIMMDLNAPVTYGESAFALIDRLREGAYVKAGNPPDLPVVIATGVRDMEMTWKDGTRIKVLEAIARGLIPEGACVDKPFSAADLNAAIQTAIGQHHGGASK
jgi:CheY-like chemotaxis protein